MTESELPDFIERDVLRDISSVTVPDEAILRCFVQANKPFLSKSAVADMTDMSDEAARKRLNSLVDRGVLLNAEAGKQTKIYWLNHPGSRWPVPDDLATDPSRNRMPSDQLIAKINRLTTFTSFFGGIFVVIYILDGLSELEITDGVFEVSLNPGVMPSFALLLFAIIFYTALQTSLLVENGDFGWPTIRRVYRLIYDRMG
ncbi:hypothetical protein Huta_1906 [Halorhabdus utahensis DSM 12940]|uniref:Uncharacterized protein n=1 Tax=Halorhabdus utahensis (strain DSM 12940 / JCM 11049 / AX-2) TaxID=519442 RepID=C7NT00_HALUD|nr:hypothetical protein [Halorhabdus utahensis]ACV12075.1 hypothetical protein Huta_1906 [Halorhabdus utahensis DSM 12940]